MMADQFPRITDLARSVSHDGVLGACDDDLEFEFGLDLILDGLDRRRYRRSDRHNARGVRLPRRARCKGCAMAKDARPPGEERDDDTFAVRAKLTEDQAVELIGRGGFDYGDRPHFGRNEDGTGSLDLFVSRSQIKALEAEGIEVEIVNDPSARMRERSAELGEGGSNSRAAK